MPIGFRTLSVVSVVALLSAAAPAGAEGPVSHTSLPGGASLSDSDPGSGEQWGRSGGRSLEYTGFDLSLFSALTWEQVGAVEIAFDGAVDSPGEQLSYSPGESTLGAGTAVWTGSTRVQLFPTGSFSGIGTRVTVTVTDLFGNGLPLGFDPARGVPELDVIQAGGGFRVNVRMEARTGISGWLPALDLFDSLETHPTETELALTSFGGGFFFEVGTGPGLGLEEHDTNMVQRTGQILGDLDFLKIESVGGFSGLRDTLQQVRAESSGRFGSLDAATSDILSRTFEILAQVENLSQNGGLATSGDVENAREDIQGVRSGVEDLLQALIQLWGLELDENGQPVPGTLKTIRSLSTQESVDALLLKGDLLQALVVDQTAPLASQQSVDGLQQGIDALAQQDEACLGQVGLLLERVSELEAALAQAAMQQLEIQVEPSPRSSKKHRRLLVLTSEAGQPVDAWIKGVFAIPEDRGFQAVPVPFDVQPVGEGLFDVEIDLDRHLKKVELVLILIEHGHDTGVHHGSVLASLED